MRRILVCVMVVGALLVTPVLSSVVRADESGAASGGDGLHAKGGLFDDGAHTRKPMLSIFLLVPFDYGFGIGIAGRYTLPIVPDGFISRLNDSFELEFGADVYYGWWGLAGATYGYFDLLVPIEARWSFHFTPKWEAYAKAGVGFRYRYFKDYDPGYSGLFDYLEPVASVGGLFHFSDTMSLRAEVGWTGLRAGLGFDL